MADKAEEAGEVTFGKFSDLDEANKTAEVESGHDTPNSGKDRSLDISEENKQTCDAAAPAATGKSETTDDKANGETQSGLYQVPLAMDLLDRFNLRISVLGHNSDVRCLATAKFGNEEVILTGSRDKSALVIHQNGRLLFPNETIRNHENYISAVRFVPPSVEYPLGLYLTGSNDQLVKAVRPDSLDSPVYELRGHQGTVSCITFMRGEILTGSWDNTAKLWDNGECKLTFEGHTGAVWAAVFATQTSEVVTGSADNTIKIWDMNNATCVNTLTAHTQAVRALRYLPRSNQLLSAANDCLIYLWDMGTRAQIRQFAGHTNYIYSLTSVPKWKADEEDLFASCGEDSCIRIWSLDRAEELQVINMPAKSIWALTALKNGDIAAGCSDCTVRVFTRHPELLASVPELAEFEAEVARNVIPAKEALDNSALNVDKLPGPEALLEPGKKEGDRKMVRIPNTRNVELYSWDVAKVVWTKIGDVVGASPKSTKSTFMGKEYDYVFSIDVQEGVPPLKLPYNLTQDPWEVAQKFIEANQLSQGYLEQIAQFIMKNAPGAGENIERSDAHALAARGGASDSYADPFTGRNRYVP